ncbi:MAG TPA: hypothetical protein PLE54_06025 [Burkholderiaceae bacterium]|nr:hypothetical protein [Burkholderiaceae bacterium]
MATSIPCCFATALLLLCASTSVQAQTPANAWNCPQQAMESDKAWYDRCTGILNAPAEASLETAKLRARLEKQPALPANRNPLLGRWQQPARPQANSSDPLSQMMQMIGNGSCTALFGEGTVEFRADRWLVTDADGPTDLGPVTYREGKDPTVVFVLPQQGAQLLPLQFESPDRWSLIGAAVPCAMVRIGAAQTRTAARSPVQVAAPAQVTSATLAVGPDAGGYACPDGRKIYVYRCYSEDPQADCSYVQLHLPPNNGFQVEAMDKRAAIAESLKGCRLLPVRWLPDGKIELAGS